MKPNSSSRSQRTNFRRAVAFTLGVLFSMVSGQAELIRQDISGPATLLYDSPSHALGSLKLGDLLAATFVYDTDDLRVAGFSPEYRTYVSDHAQISATIDEVRYDFTRFELIVQEKGVWGFYDGTYVVADSMELRAISVNGAVNFDAALLWPEGTLSRFDVVAPPVDPALVHITWAAGDSDGGTGSAFSMTHFEELSSPPPPPVISPVPEPATFGWAGVALLAGSVAKRRWRAARA